jgi:hypothetical protein
MINWVSTNTTFLIHFVESSIHFVTSGLLGGCLACNIAAYTSRSLMKFLSSLHLTVCGSTPRQTLGDPSFSPAFLAIAGDQVHAHAAEELHLTSPSRHTPAWNPLGSTYTSQSIVAEDHFNSQSGNIHGRVRPATLKVLNTGSRDEAVNAGTPQVQNSQDTPTLVLQTCKPLARN